MLPVFPLLALMIDAARVIEIRIWMMALGRTTPDELLLMVNAKVGAMEDAAAILMRGGSSVLVINNYHKIVAANVARLSPA